MFLHISNLRHHPLTLDDDNNIGYGDLDCHTDVASVTSVDMDQSCSINTDQGELETCEVTHQCQHVLNTDMVLSLSGHNIVQILC